MCVFIRACILFYFLTYTNKTRGQMELSFHNNHLLTDYLLIHVSVVADKGRFDLHTPRRGRHCDGERYKHSVSTLKCSEIKASLVHKSNHLLSFHRSEFVNHILGVNSGTCSVPTTPRTDSRSNFKARTRHERVNERQIFWWGGACDQTMTQRSSTSALRG